MGRSAGVSYILVYKISKGHRLAWNGWRAPLSALLHPSLQAGGNVFHTRPRGYLIFPR